MKSTEKHKINEFIDSQIKKILFEEEEVDNTTNMMKYFTDEEKRLKTDIDTNNRLKSVQINPDERKVKETNIKRNKERLAKIKQMEDDLKAQQEMKKKADQVKSTTQKSQIQVGGVAENMGAPIIKREFAEQAPAMAAPAALAPQKKRIVRVTFDKSTGAPFQIDFSERGFSINGTRLSFETIESALSKEFNIVLDHGQGLTLDQVKMQKILKYKDRY